MSQAPAQAPPVLAAGAVVWRMVDGKARVLVVHRPAHKDVSLPKGKLDPGESLPQTAVREIQEETGLSVSLGAPLGRVEYVMQNNGRDKVVHYWSAEVHDHQLELAKFVPNSEISQLEWLPIKAAVQKLTYPHDRDIVQRLRERIKTDTARTFGVIVLRHGKAVPPGAWDGPDATRPLLHRGSDQAKAIAGGIAAFAPERIISSTAARCLATVAPLAAATGLPVKQEAGISQDAYEYGQSEVQRIVGRRLKQRQTVVLCSHGPVIPEIIGEVGRELGADGSGLHHAGMLGTADYTVLHISRKKPQLVAVETHTPPTPA